MRSCEPSTDTLVCVQAYAVGYMILQALLTLCAWESMQYFVSAAGAAIVPVFELLLGQVVVVVLCAAYLAIYLAPTYGNLRLASPTTTLQEILSYGVSGWFKQYFENVHGDHGDESQPALAGFASFLYHGVIPMYMLLACVRIVQSMIMREYVIARKPHQLRSGRTASMRRATSIDRAWAARNTVPADAAEAEETELVERTVHERFAGAPLSLASVARLRLLYRAAGGVLRRAHISGVREVAATVWRRGCACLAGFDLRQRDARKLWRVWAERVCGTTHVVALAKDLESGLSKYCAPYGRCVGSLTFCCVDAAQERNPKLLRLQKCCGTAGGAAQAAGGPAGPRRPVCPACLR